MSKTLRKSFPTLQSPLSVDVAVIGGGITGVTAAYLLKQAGVKVALFERGLLGSRDTGHTTAHLSYVTDLRISELAGKFGKDHAQAAWDAGLAAMRQIDDLIQINRIDCDYRCVPGYLHTPWFDRQGDLPEKLKSDARLAQELGFRAEFRESIPWIDRAGIVFPNQAKFHPLKYILALAEKISGDGSFVFENAEASEFSDDPLGFQVGSHQVHCNKIVIATHVPLMGTAGMIGSGLFQSKLSSYSSYAICATMPKSPIGEAIFWDTSDPYFYIRIEQNDDQDSVIMGGCDHKTGQSVDAQSQYHRLEEILAMCLPGAEVTHQWTGQVVETNDGLPYIGETSPEQFIATGFAGNGMTFGTLAGMMATDFVLGRKNPWRDLFSPSRSTILGGAWDYVKENIDYPYYLIKDRLAKTESTSPNRLGRNEGAIMRINGERVAVYRDEVGKLTQLSPICSHLGCLVRWNQDESTWECPCHGSRFKATGEVIAGPAESGLKRLASDLN